MFFSVGCFFFKIISWFLFPVRTRGLENLPSQGGFILASNHISNLDPFLIGSFCPHYISFVAKESLFKNKILGFALGLLRAYPIRRGGADFRAMRETLRRLKHGSAVLIFPEGTRKVIAEKKRALPGIGFIASKSGAPVFPVFIEGSDQSLPPGRKFPRRHPVTIIFGKRISYSREDSYSKIAEQILREVYVLSPSLK